MNDAGVVLPCPGMGGARRKPGPKPKPAAERYRNRVQVGLSDAQFEALEALAAEAGEAMSEYIRRVLADHLARRVRTKRGR